MQIDAVTIQIKIHLRLALGYLSLGGGEARGFRRLQHSLGVPEFRRLQHSMG